jgi:hypothetical protein
MFGGRKNELSKLKTNPVFRRGRFGCDRRLSSPSFLSRIDAAELLVVG